MAVDYSAVQDMLRGLVGTWTQTAENPSACDDDRTAASDRRAQAAASDRRAQAAADLQQLRAMSDAQVEAVAERYRADAEALLNR